MTRRDWADFGRDELASLVQPGQMSSLRYLFQLKDQRERWLRASRGSKAISRGGLGHEVINPLLRQMPSLNKEIATRSAEFGMTPASRKKLVGTVVSGELGKKTLAEVLDNVDLDDEDDEVEVEPARLSVVA